MASAVIFGSGFVGAAVREAMERTFEITVLDIPTHPALARRDAEAAAIVDEELARTGARVVVNTAGRLGGSDSELAEANVEWPAWLVGRLAGSGVRFVHLGSAAEYGDPASADPIAETAPTPARGSYGTTKLAGSLAVLDSRARGVDAVVARAFNLVGPGTTPASPLHQFVSDVTNLPPHGGEVEVWWPATLRDFVLLEDLGAAVAALAALDRIDDGAAIVNVCSGLGISFGEIVTAIGKRQDKPVTLRSLDRRGIEAVIGDNSRLIALTGIEPQMSAELIARRCALA